MNKRKFPYFLTILRLIVISIFVLGAAGAPRLAFAQSTRDYTIIDNDHDGLEDSVEDTLMKKYAPFMKFHDCEHYLPASIEWYLSRTSLAFHHPSKADHQYSPNPITSYANLNYVEHDGVDFSGALKQISHGQTGFTDTDFFLHLIDSSNRVGDWSGNSQGQLIKNWPVYAHVRPAPSSHPGMIDIQYWFFYPGNGTLGDECGYGYAGEHEGDWEHVTVRVRAEGDYAHAVFYSTHGEGIWRDTSADNYENYSSTQRPVVYPAYHSHANYPDNGDNGKHDRGALPSDFTSDHGLEWDTTPNVVNLGERNYPREWMGWIQYTGKWGEYDMGTAINPNGPNGPAMKGSWSADPSADNETAPVVLMTNSTKQALPGQALTFDLGRFTTNQLGPYTATVRWGDGTYTDFYPSPDTAMQAAHTYTGNPIGLKIYTGSITVRDLFTAGSASFIVKVSPSLPPAPDSDLDAPQIRIVPIPAADGANGWHLGPAGFDVQARDASGMFVVRCALNPETEPVEFSDLPEDDCAFFNNDGSALIPYDGTHKIYAAAMDVYGNMGELVQATLQIDATPPVIDCKPETFLQNSGEHPVSPYETMASVSGLNEAASTLSGVVTTESAGLKTVTFTAVDLAGHQTVQTCNYNVMYNFGGFFAPVKPAPALNPATTGSALPLKFSLAGNQGLDVLAALTTQQVDCQTLAPLGTAAPAQMVGTGPRYDPLTGLYSLVWKTGKTWAGTCRMVSLQLVDATQHPAYFMFK